MSDQSKGNMQVIGAGVMGFIAVVGVAGLVLTHDSGRGSVLSRASAPAPAVSAPEPVIARQALSRERPSSSPAPLVGSVADVVPGHGDAGAAATHAASGASVSAAAPASAAPALGAMGDPRFAGKGESVTSARAEVAKAAAPEPKEAAAPAFKAVPRIALDKTQARGSIASAVHYGVTSRNELMGKAAGPVYNFTGRQVAGGSRLAELSSHADKQMTEAERNIEASNLTPEQKAEMRQKLRQAVTTAPAK